MLNSILKERENYINTVGYPMPLVNLTQEQYKELQEDLRGCASGMCPTHAPNEVMGTKIRVVG
jgi:hypothetical protein